MTLLQCEQPSEIGGATTWINTTSAFRKLSKRMQQYLVGLTAVHTASGMSLVVLRACVVCGDEYVC